MWPWIKTHKVTIGAIWGIATTIFSIYATLFPFERNPELVFYEKDTQDVFSLKDTIHGLEIFCNGVDVKKSGLGLKTYSIKLINQGKRDIKREDYGEAPFGLTLKDGYVLGIKIGQASDVELSKKLVDKTNRDSTKIILNKLFIGKDEWVKFQFWVLYNKKMEPSIQDTMGRISDSEILYTNEEESKDWGWLDFIQLILGFGAGIILILVVGATIHYFIYYMKRIYRRINFMNYYENRFDKHILEHRILLKTYFLLGKKTFIDILAILNEKERLNTAYQQELENVKLVAGFTELLKQKKAVAGTADYKGVEYKSPLMTVLDLFRSFGYLEERDNKLELKESMLDEINKALEIFSFKSEINK